jgi:hypothetical protein
MQGIDVTLGEFSCRFEIWEPTRGRVFEDRFAIDTETTEIDSNRPDRVPQLVLLVACDGERGCFVASNHIIDFLAAHPDSELIFHNAPFDLAVIQQCIGDEEDIYDRVDANKIWDTLILRRLLSLAHEGHTARGESSLAQCSSELLGIKLEKRRTDSEGHDVRTGFGRFRGLHITAIPVEFLQYAAADVLATWLLFGKLINNIKGLFRNTSGILGAPDRDVLRGQIEKYGPLSHHIQVRASIVCDQMTRNGICVDVDAAMSRSAELDAAIDKCTIELGKRGYVPGRAGNQGVLQRLISDIAIADPTLSIPRTPSGDRFSTKAEVLVPLGEIDPIFISLVELKQAGKLKKTYASRLTKTRIHPRFGYLLATGRTYCSGAINLQNLPKEDSLAGGSLAKSIRSLLGPAPGNVFIDVDYSQIELVVLAAVLRDQLHLGGSLALLINGGEDIHRSIAANVLDRPVDQISKADRNSAKPISFGRPGGMGATTLQEVARKNYGMDLSLSEVEKRIEAYHRLVPELDAFLSDEVDSALRLAEELRLNPIAYSEFIGTTTFDLDERPQGWLGWMLLRVLRDARPATRRGRAYSDREIDFFWQAAQALIPMLPDEFADQIANRRPSEELYRVVQDHFGQRSVMTATGRIRAKASFCASRNSLFQGLAADGAILGLWNLFRAGYRIIAFIHDQVVVEYPEADDIPEAVRDIERLMIAGMSSVIPGMLIQVESAVRRSLDKSDIIELADA